MLEFGQMGANIPIQKVKRERLQKLYQSKDIYTLLKERRLDFSEHEPGIDHKTGLRTKFPLEFFDSAEFERHTPEEWIADIEESKQCEFAGARALIEKKRESTREWIKCEVHSYDDSNKLYTVKCLDTEAISQVKRLELLFNSENPFLFADRLKYAFDLRRQVESYVRYTLFVNNMPAGDLPPMQTKLLNEIVERTGVPLDDLDVDINTYLAEVDADFKRGMNKELFDFSLSTEQFAKLRNSPDLMDLDVDLLNSFVTMPKKHRGCVEMPEYNFCYQFHIFRNNSFSNFKQVIEASNKIQIEIEKLNGTPIFQIDLPKSVSRDEFETLQMSKMTEFSSYVKRNWLTALKNGIMSSLRDVDKGWFNLRMRQREVYMKSKLHDYLAMVNFQMEDALRMKVRQDLNRYHELIKSATNADVKITDTSTFEVTYPQGETSARKEPLFLLDLIIKDGVIVTSIDLEEDCRQMVLRLFNQALRTIHDTPQIETLVMEHFYSRGGDVPNIKVVQRAEPWVDALYQKIDATLQRSIGFVAEYVQKFKKLEKILAIDVQEYVQNFFSEDPDLAAIEKEIQSQITKRNNILAQILKSADIGLFSVKCESVRNRLADKYTEIRKLEISTFVYRIRAQTKVLNEEFEAVIEQLKKPCPDIGTLAAMKDFMSTIPGIIETKEPEIQDILEKFDRLYVLRYNMSKADFALRWQVYGWPKAVQDQIAEVNTAMTEEKKKYFEAMQEQQEDFASEIEQVRRDVESFDEIHNFDKLEATAAKARDVQSRLTEFQQRANVFNSKECAFGVEVTDYAKLSTTAKLFEPFFTLWDNAQKWVQSLNGYMHNSFTEIDPEAVKKDMSNYRSALSKATRSPQIRDNEEIRAIATIVEEQITEFKPKLFLITSLAQEGVAERHWELLSSKCGVEMTGAADLTLDKAINQYNLLEHKAIIEKTGERSSKEFQIEKALDTMEEEWNSVEFDIDPYKETGTYRLKGADDVFMRLDEQRVTTQAMSFSSFKGPFEERITEWDRKLQMITEVVDAWLIVQRNWLHLQPIFDSADIMKQLPLEGKKFNQVDKTWRQAMKSAKQNPEVLTFADNESLLNNFKSSGATLEQVQKGLSDYLNQKRSAFARFYFLADDELLQILSQTKDPTAVQPHLKKCFDNIAKAEFDENNIIRGMYSSKGEYIPFVEEIDPSKSQVEVWLGQLERVMYSTMKSVLNAAYATYFEMHRVEWLKTNYGQSLMTDTQIVWTKEVEHALNEGGLPGLTKYLEKLNVQLQDMVEMIRGDIPKLVRKNVGALIVLDVHNLNVVENMVKSGVEEVNDFEWIRQLRYYIDDNEDIQVKMVQAVFPYGYEYQGNQGRLVVTPLTERCYMTMIGALSLHLGGAPAGPAGTGKTETIKDLAKNMAKYCVVFNCSDSLDTRAMAKFFKGLASSGAWACFDEFNRIDIEVLSVVAQQIGSIWGAVRAHKKTFIFDEQEIVLNPTCSVFITMNPGYAGRTELPDNLVALFRPVAMMVPDYALIGEIMLYSFGFENSAPLSKKLTATFKLCSEQLSSQDHYDYGLRAVIAIIKQAGNLKKAFPKDDEDILLLRAICDVNVPKFLPPDLELFYGIVNDLFPGKKKPDTDYGPLLTAIYLTIEEMQLQRDQIFVDKILQLYETICVRHGLMVVGPTCSGKTENIHVLRKAIDRLAGIEDYTKVIMHTVNPKSVTMSRLYGAFDAVTHEWTDGLLPIMIRECVADTSSTRKWVIFDGPVDTLWIENMNTVLDDNKKLCLNSGEIIALTDTISMIFEVEDLAVASPATVSRCGMVYMDPEALGTGPIYQSWLEQLPKDILPMRPEFRCLYDLLFTPCVDFLRRQCAEPVPSVDANLCQSLMNVIDVLVKPFTINHTLDEEDQIQPQEFKDLYANSESVFIFALIWSIGATTDFAGRKRFDTFLRIHMRQLNLSVTIPEDNLVFDYRFNMQSNTWVDWMESQPEFKVKKSITYADIIVPTVDSVRYTYFLDLLMKNDNHVLFTGNTGTGKTVNIQKYLATLNTKKYQPLVMMFSAATTAAQIQGILDTRLDSKRRQRVYGPPPGSKCVLFVDDMNMPQREVFFAQPPIEFLRQWADHTGWWKPIPDYAFCHVLDIVMIGSMGPPGGGRNPVTPRFLRHFNQIAHTDLGFDSLYQIFNTILTGKAIDYTEVVRENLGNLVKATIQVYGQVCECLLPTPSKSHYTFNLRDLSSVMQGLLSSIPKSYEDLESYAKLWVHENRRVFADRLVNTEDTLWFDNLLAEKMQENLSLEWDSVISKGHRLVFGDYGNGLTADDKPYVEITEEEKLRAVMNDALEDFNADTPTPMNLVLFLDAIEHVSRISRVLRQPQGNVLLLGVGGSGRQSLSRLATFMGGFELFRIELAKNYGVPEWREDLKTCLMMAGIEQKQTVFLFTDTQILQESFLEDINNILNSGTIPGIYEKEDMDKINEVCRIECQRKKIAPTKLNMFQQYINRVRANLHLVICMSPVGDAFRTRLRMFPALVNCCTIDWFSAWPKDALQAVALSKIQSNHDIKVDQLDEVVEVFTCIHQSVEEKSKEFAAALGRHSYVTPTSYLELLVTFQKLLEERRKEVTDARDKLDNGVKKLDQAALDVAELSEKLTAMQPVLKKTQVEVEEMMVELTKDKEEAEKTKDIVSEQESAAKKQADECSAIKEDAEADLAKALPALKAATKCLNELQRSDIDEIKAMRNPPGGVRLTMEVVCIVFKEAPKKKMVDGKRVLDYWDSGKGLIQNAKKFLEKLINFDKDAMEEKVVKKMAPYMENPEFTPDRIEQVSKACRAVCMWCHAMFTYYHVARDVEPKRQRLAQASETLKKTEAELAEAQAKLQAVLDRLADLEAKYNKAVAEKDRLAKQVEMTSIKLGRADKLIGGLGGEKARWSDSVVRYNDQLQNVLGDIVVASGSIAYLGAFTNEYREALYAQWREKLKSLGVRISEGCNVQNTLGKPVKIRHWNICGLPTDQVSVENGIIIDKAARWPLMIDPQCQANKFIKKLAEADAPNGFDVVKLSDGKNFTRTLEAGIRFGKWIILENVLEALDPQLDPILSRAIFMVKGQPHIRFGDANLPYNDSFRLFITTKLPNPHYPPELQVKVSLLNFTVTPSGLQDQMLGLVVAKEAPELEVRKNELVMSNAKMKEQLQELEDKILKLLKDAEGDILEDETLINTLSESKTMSEEISAKVKEQELVEKEIDAARLGFIPAAYRASILYFCVADMAPVDPMYQFSLQWFIALFSKGIDDAEAASEHEQRLQNINDHFTLSVYKNVCQSLFEKDKLLFSFLLCVKIMQGDGKINTDEFRHLVTVGHVPNKAFERPSEEWMTDVIWEKLSALENLSIFEGVIEAIKKDMGCVKKYYDSDYPHRETLPGNWDEKLDQFQKLLLLRSLRPDRLEPAMQDFITANIGRSFIEPPPFDMQGSFDVSSPTSALIFILSSGADPYAELVEFAKQKGEYERMLSISLGMGQGPIAERYIRQASQEGGWVVLQNCHLCISWLPKLEKICEDLIMNSEEVHEDFRLWLTSMPTKKFPVSVLQNGVKMTNEPPKGLRANLLRSYLGFTDEFLNDSTKPEAFKKMLFGLCMYHAVILDRRKFGPLGWNIPYGFRESDLSVCISQLHDFLDMFEEIPFKVIHFLIYDVNYGGRITDAKDSRTAEMILDGFMNPNVLEDNYNFSPSGKYVSIPATNKDGYLEYIRGLDLVPQPEVFGFHQNALITFSVEESDKVFSTLASLLPRNAGGSGKTKDEVTQELAADILTRTPRVIDIETLKKMYPTKYEQSMNTVLVQESIRYNKLLSVMAQSLSDLQKAIKGEMVMTGELEAMANSLFDNIVPKNWEAVAYPSLMPLAAWVNDLVTRMDFINKWIKHGVPKVYWISGFFFPQAFLTGTLQNFARKYTKEIDTISFGFKILKQTGVEAVSQAPEDGCYITGLHLEGCRWDSEAQTLSDSRPKELFVAMPNMWMLPEENRVEPTSGIYKCPVYKVLTRRGQLSTTGHSTNFVMFIELPSDQTERKWVKAGAAMFCALKY